MDLLDAVALSTLPGFPRRRLGESRSLAVGPPAERGRTSGTLPALLRGLGLASPKLLRAVDQARRRAADMLEDAATRGMEAIGWTDARYPVSLAAITDPPPVLWVRGDVSTLLGVTVAVVGSRAATPYALEVAAWLGNELAARGVTVVSGLARGVDSAAHRGAVTAGCTVAVLGSGADVVYPAEHDRLARSILVRGAIISELPPGTPPRPGQFPLRNRIISGLSRAVVVVEAGERSGSLITARCGLEQGREVMAVPGSVLGGRHRGSHALLKDGAKVVENVNDILEEIAVPLDGTAEQSLSPEPSDDPTVRCMSAGEPYDVDELAERSGIHGAALLARLLELELRGVVGRTDGGRFVRLVRRW